MKLKRITLGFENCEIADIPAEMVTYMLISGITTTQIYTGGGDVETFSECNDCEIHILSAAGEALMEWEHGDGKIPTLAERLQMFHDIVFVELDYGDRVDSYRVNWAEGNEYENENMSVADEGDEIRISIG